MGTQSRQCNDPVDTAWMQRALVLAERGRGQTRPNPPVGALIVDTDGTLVGEGYHRRAGGPHAEVLALAKAGPSARGGTIYVTLEPCSTHGRTGPCTDAIISAGIKRVVVAARDPNPAHKGRGLRLLRAAGISVETGLCRVPASDIIRGFSTWVTQNRPHVTLKLGMTADGRIADSGGRSQWITSPRARSLVQRMRRDADAVMVGGETARLDNPSLLCAKPRKLPLLRVVVDDVGALPPASRVFCDGCACQTIVATTQRCSARRRTQYEQSGADVWMLPAVRNGVSLRHLMARLGNHGVLDLLCEGGGQLAASLVRQQLVDRYVLFYAPALLGGDARAAFGGKGWPLQGMPRLKFESLERVGPDIMVSAIPAKDG